jgi:hypothetical protein
MPSCEVCLRNAYYGTDTPRFCRSHKESGMKNVVSPLCEELGCVSTSRTFGFPGQKGVRCKKHALPGMVNVVNPLCDAKGCLSTSRVFGQPGVKKRYCKEHALPTMVNVVNPTCEHPGCPLTSRNFDLPGGKGRFCKRHAEEGMVNVRNAKCLHSGCLKKPTYGLKGKPSRYCAEHKLPGMCIRYACEAEGCTIQAGCNYEGETLGRFCSAHKLEGMINIHVRKCTFPSCAKTASFGFTSVIRCKTHAEPEMKNLLAKLCEADGCDITASYALPGHRAKVCQRHSTAEMVCVIGRTCEVPGCGSRSRYYDVPGGKGRFCTRHKEPGMVDVQNPKCESCDSIAKYGLPGCKPSRCTRHRLAGMLLRPRAKCTVCRKPAVYGQNFVATHCESHRTNDDQNLMERTCVSCGLLMVLDVNNKCEFCDPVRFETNRLAKQTALMTYLDKHHLRGNSTDVVIEKGACGRERPDRVFEFEDKVVILECDEHQHKDRQCLCEQTRMSNIGQSFGGTPVYFLRWNPDTYAPGDIRDPEPVAKRHKLVADYLHQIEKGLVDFPVALVSVLYLYHDGWTTLADARWEILTPVEPL